MRVYVCMCLCVCEREGEYVSPSNDSTSKNNDSSHVCARVCEYVNACVGDHHVCMYVYVRVYVCEKASLYVWRTIPPVYVMVVQSTSIAICQVGFGSLSYFKRLSNKSILKKRQLIRSVQYSNKGKRERTAQ